MWGEKDRVQREKGKGKGKRRKGQQAACVTICCHSHIIVGTSELIAQQQCDPPIQASTPIRPDPSADGCRRVPAPLSFLSLRLARLRIRVAFDSNSDRVELRLRRVAKHTIHHTHRVRQREQQQHPLAIRTLSDTDQSERENGQKGKGSGTKKNRRRENTSETSWNV